MNALNLIAGALTGALVARSILAAADFIATRKDRP